MQEVRVFTEPVSIVAQHSAESLFLLEITFPLVHTVMGASLLQFLQHELVRVHDIRQFFDPNCSVQ